MDLLIRGGILELGGVTHFLQVALGVLCCLHIVQLPVVVTSQRIALGCLRVWSLLAQDVALHQSTWSLVLLLDYACLLHLLKKSGLLLLKLLLLDSLQI